MTLEGHITGQLREMEDQGVWQGTGTRWFSEEGCLLLALKFLNFGNVVRAEIFRFG